MYLMRKSLTGLSASAVPTNIGVYNIPATCPRGRVFSLPPTGLQVKLVLKQCVMDTGANQHEYQRGQLFAGNDVSKCQRATNPFFERVEKLDTLRKGKVPSPSAVRYPKLRFSRPTQRSKARQHLRIVRFFVHRNRYSRYQPVCSSTRCPFRKKACATATICSS